MKTIKHITPFITIGLAVAAFIAGMHYHRLEQPPTPQQLTLEQILSIRELHLVKHTYTDLFMLHKKNNPDKAIRAMVQVPVTVTAYLNLKDIELLRAGDSIRHVILPRAILNEPVYHVANLVVRETRGFQLHAGKDLYPEVVKYLGTTIGSRLDTTRYRAESNRILLQAEAEGKEYVQGILQALGRGDVQVTFQDDERDAQVTAYLEAMQVKPFAPTRIKSNFAKASVIPFGFLPLR